MSTHAGPFLVPNPRVEAERRAGERKVKLDAAIDSFRNVFALLGVGFVFANFYVMHWIFVVPGAALLAGVWYADYRRHF